MGKKSAFAHLAGLAGTQPDDLCGMLEKWEAIARAVPQAINGAATYSYDRTRERRSEIALQLIAELRKMLRTEKDRGIAALAGTIGFYAEAILSRDVAVASDRLRKAHGAGNQNFKAHNAEKKEEAARLDQEIKQAWLALKREQPDLLMKELDRRIAKQFDCKPPRVARARRGRRKKNS